MEKYYYFCKLTARTRLRPMQENVPLRGNGRYHDLSYTCYFLF